MGVRINCIGDQNQGQPELVRVAVPKIHPLFNLEGDDPFDIPYRLNRFWVAKAYSGKIRNSSSSNVDSGLANPMARLLLIQTAAENGKWVGLVPWLHDSNIGSLLVVVQRSGGDLEVGEVRHMCHFIKQRILPLMTAQRALTLRGQQEVLAAITEENLAMSS
jgi:hypothetical protein